MQEAERRQRQALDHHLHAEVGHVPARVLDDVVEQHPQVGVDLEPAAQLLVDVAVEDLDVAGFVHRLRRGVQLGVVPRHGLDDLGGAQQRALLAVQELRERPAPLVDAELEPLLVAPLRDDRAVVVVGCEARLDRRLVGGHDLLEVDVGVPRQIGGGVPLADLGLLVQLAQLRASERVVPREDRVGVVLHDVLDLVDVGVGDRQDGLDVVDVVAADDRFVAGVRDGHGVTPVDVGRSGGAGWRRRASGASTAITGRRNVASRSVVAEIDVVAGGEEVRDREASEHVDQSCAAVWRRRSWRPTA